MPALRYSSDREPGCRRRRHGRGERYLDERGRQVRDPRVVHRLKALAIPPAWHDVWICRSSRGHLQATGIDAAGRKQYLYHPAWREERDREKYAPSCASPIACRPCRRPRSATCAAAASTVTRPWRRRCSCSTAPSSASAARSTRRRAARRAGDLSSRHLTVEDDLIVLDFEGKGGADEHAEVESAGSRACSRRWTTCRVRGAQVPRRRRTVVDVRSEDVDAYIQEHAGEEFSAKDFRTWAGTVAAAVALDEVGPVNGARFAPRAVSAVCKRAASLLGNTPAVCRANYIDPRVIDHFLDGRTISSLCGPRSSGGSSRAGARRRSRCWHSCGGASRSGPPPDREGVEEVGRTSAGCKPARSGVPINADASWHRRGPRPSGALGFHSAGRTTFVLQRPSRRRPGRAGGPTGRRGTRTSRGPRPPAASTRSRGRRRERGWRRGRAGRRAGQSLAQVLEAAGDVAADVVRVLPSSRPGRGRRGRGSARGSRARSARPALDALGHVHRRPVGHVAVGPGRVPPGGGPGRVGDGLLGQQHVGALRVPPVATTASAAAISAIVPPRCTVAGAAALRRPPGDRAVERPVHLEDARAVAVAAEAAAVRGGQPRPGDRQNWRGVTSNSTARAGGSSSSDATRARSRSRRRATRGSAASASASRCEPPRATGHPTACAEHREQQTEAARSAARRAADRVRGHARRTAPAPRSVAEAPRPRPRPSAAPARPKRASANGWRGSRERPEQGRRSGVASRRRAAPSACGRPRRPRPEGRRPSPSPSAPARPPSRRRAGGRAAIVGCTSSTPISASGRVRKNGDAGASGWTAEQTSCTKPGSVSSAERAPPPTVSAPRSPAPTALPGEGDRRRQPVGPRPHDDCVVSAHFRVKPDRRRGVFRTMGRRAPMRSP